MVTESHNILPRWQNHFSQLLKVEGVNDVRKTEIHTAEPLVLLRLRWLLKSQKDTKSPGTDQIPAELIKAGGHSDIRKLINSIGNEEELPEEWKKSIIVPTCKKSNKTDCSNYKGVSLLPTTYKILSHILLSK
jgi:hypothetical protein